MTGGNWWGLKPEFWVASQQGPSWLTKSIWRMAKLSSVRMAEKRAIHLASPCLPGESKASIPQHGAPTGSCDFWSGLWHSAIKTTKARSKAIISALEGLWPAAVVGYWSRAFQTYLSGGTRKTVLLTVLQFPFPCAAPFMKGKAVTPTPLKGYFYTNRGGTLICSLPRILSFRHKSTPEHQAAMARPAVNSLD